MPHRKILLALLGAVTVATPSFGDDSIATPRSALTGFLETVEASNAIRRIEPCAPLNSKLGQLPNFAPVDLIPPVNPSLPVETDEHDGSARMSPPSPHAIMATATLDSMVSNHSMAPHDPPSPPDTIRQVHGVNRWEVDSSESTPIDEEQRFVFRPDFNLNGELALALDSERNLGQSSPMDRSASTTMIGAGKPVREMDLSGAFEPAVLPKSQYRPSRLGSDFRDPYAGALTRISKRWTADNLAHRTLYFEDLRLERYGQSHCDIMQSHLSFLRFITDAVVAPFRLVCVSPHTCFYVQCEGRPGAPRDQVGR